MKKNNHSCLAFFNPHSLIAFALCAVGIGLAVLGFGPSLVASQPPFPPVQNTVTNGGLTVVAKVFTSGGWVQPGGDFPVVLTYKNGGSAVPGAVIRVTLNSASIFQSSIPAPNSGNGTSGSPLVYNLGTVTPNATGTIGIQARAKDLTEDPEVIWKDVSATLTLETQSQSPLPATTHGPKVTTLDTARYGDRPFPVVMVQYQDVKHCSGNGTRAGGAIPSDPSCSANHTATSLDTAINSRTTGKSVWQLYQDESFGQLFVDGKVTPQPSSPDKAYTAGYNYHFTTPSPKGTCTGTTIGPAIGPTLPPPPGVNRIETGWYSLPGTENYYGSDSTGHALLGAETGVGLLFGIDDACGPTGKMAYDAAAIADEDIDYNDYDTDKDGVVDFFNVVFAGDGGNGSISATGINNVWPHSSDLRSYFTDANGLSGYISNDQFRNRLGQLVYWTDSTRKVQTTTVTAFPVFVVVGPYNVNPETAVESVSVIAHEYGHSLGLPDYYSTGTRGTMGSFDLNGTDYFQYHSIFSRQDLGWLVPRPLTTGTATLTESKFDTGTIYWTRPDGTPYTLTGPGIHNGNVYRVGLVTRILIDSVPSGTRAWFSGSGNAFGCATDGHGHNLDFFIPELEQSQYASATAVTLTFKHFYEIEWDFDYGFVLASTDGGRTWTALASTNNYTTPSVVNPNANSCQSTYGNGITGVSDGDATNDATKRVQGDYSGAMFVNDQFDLTPYKGKSLILRFSYSTDPGLAKRGWFIDDIKIMADTSVVYSSDFEASDERTRIFPLGWSRVSSADGSPADHAYYIELRDRISNDYDGKGQSERGSPSFEGGISMIYTDESHGYGNFGVDDPPAETPVDANPQPGNENPNLNDSTFTLARPTFDACTHIDNYTDPNGPGGQWKMPDGLKFTVTAMNGMTGPSAPLPATPATATITAEVFPLCGVTVVSRKTHGAAGTFDVPLPTTGTPGIECRNATANPNSHQVVFSFTAPVTMQNASVTPGTNPGATAQLDGPATISGDGKTITVNLKNVSNAQTLSVNLLGVNAGQGLINLSTPMGVLLGDVNATGNVDAADVGQVQRQNNKPVGSSNFRMDVNVGGNIDAADVGQVQRQNSKHL